MKKGKKKGTYDLMFSDGTSHIVSEDLVVNLRLLRGKELTGESMKTFLREKAMDEAMQKTKDYGLRKPRSVYQAETYLKCFELTPSQEKVILTRLHTMGILDDKRFIETLVDREFYEKRYGKRKLRRLLREAGIEADVVRDRLGRIPASDIEENLRILFDKKRSRMRNRTVKAAMKAIIGYMTNRGYDYARVKRYVDARRDDLDHVIDEAHVLEKDYHKLVKKWDGRMDDERKMRDKIIRSLLRKGHDYGAIKKMIDEG